MRQVILDTETTGLEPEQGHRVIEVGCIEVVNRRRTGRKFHRYLWPDREIDAGALQVHGLTEEFLRGQPRFADIAAELLEFIRDAELVIHNAPFDVAFLDAEFRRLAEPTTVGAHCTVLDTLQLAPARYDRLEIQQFRVLRALIARAVRYQDPDCLGLAATASARISQRHLPKQHFERVLEIAEEAGACGVQVAHSGSLLGILFDRTGRDLRHRAGRVAASAERSGFRDVEIHQINDDGAKW